MLHKHSPAYPHKALLESQSRPTGLKPAPLGQI